MDKIKDFWQFFSSIQQELHESLSANPDNWAALIQEHLSKVHKDLVFDIPFELHNGKHELIISADGDKTLFSLVDALVEDAPKYQNWVIISLRPRTNQIDQAVELDGLYLSYEDIFFEINKLTIPLEITIYINGFDTKDMRYVHSYFILLDTLIGERNVSLYTKTINVFPRNNNEGTPLIKIRDIFDELQKKELQM